jgi:DNA-binding protein H-NS
MNRQEALAAIDAEADSAQEKYGDYASMHEAYGVLAEEVDELWDIVKMRQNADGRAAGIRRESLQVAAVALRIAEQAERVTR